MTVWRYLQDAPIEQRHFSKEWSTYYGGFIEKLSRRIIHDLFNYPQFDFRTVFPSFREVLSTKWYSPNRNGRMIYKDLTNMTSDLLCLVHGKYGEGNYGKKALVFEVKSGVTSINAPLIAYWREILLHPKNYISKCDEAKLYVLWVHGVDVHSHQLFYSLKEVKSDEIPSADEGLDGVDRVKNN